MSNYFDLFCRTCDVKGDVFHSNWGDRMIASIVHDLPALKEMHAAYLKTQTDLRFGERTHSEDCHTISVDLLEFASKHAGHDVAARSEYGNFHDRCEHRYSCPCCQHGQACQLDPGHAGDHGPRPKEAA